MDNYVNLVFLSIQVEGKKPLEKFVLGWFICLAVIELIEKTHIGNLDILAQNPAAPVEDVDVIICLRKQ